MGCQVSHDLDEESSSVERQSAEDRSHPMGAPAFAEDGWRTKKDNNTYGRVATSAELDLRFFRRT